MAAVAHRRCSVRWSIESTSTSSSDLVESNSQLAGFTHANAVQTREVCLERLLKKGWLWGRRSGGWLEKHGDSLQLHFQFSLYLFSIVFCIFICFFIVFFYFFFYFSVCFSFFAHVETNLKGSKIQVEFCGDSTNTIKIVWCIV